jgi:4a-hydroxytetrahydrobiopterin dehydratase
MPARGRDDLRDALHLLKEWIGDAREIRRTMRLDEAEHAALTERIKVVADALELRPDVRRRNGCTEVRLGTPNGGSLTASEVNLAARIEDAYRSVTAPSRRTSGSGT